MKLYTTLILIDFKSPPSQNGRHRAHPPASHYLLPTLQEAKRSRNPTLTASPKPFPTALRESPTNTSASELSKQADGSLPHPFSTQDLRFRRITLSMPPPQGQ